MLKTETARWFALPRPRNRVRLRLFCFPYGGGGASLFREWPDEAPANVDVCAVHLPGRERRLMEPPPRCMEDLRAPLAEAIGPLLDVPFAFFGHSMGALIAFELARELSRRGGPQPVLLFTSGCRAPRLPERSPPTHHLPTADFVEEIRRLNGMPDELLDAPELLELVLPTLRADMALCETYRYAEEPRLDCGLRVLAGDRDPDVPPEDLSPWAEVTRSETRWRLFPGDHFFLHGERGALLTYIRDELAGVLGRPPLEPSTSPGADSAIRHQGAIQ